MSLGPLKNFWHEAFSTKNRDVSQFLCISPRSCSFQNIVKMTKMPSSPKLMYETLDSILKVFKQEEYGETREVQELLKIYEKEKNACTSEDRKHPLIILEGLDGSGKTTVGDRFAKKIRAVKCRTPPESVSFIRSFFDDHKELRTAFYSLGNYIAALEVQRYLKTSPVVMDRYWHSTVAFAMAQAVQDFPDQYIMPPEGDKCYCWPEDLYKPDIVILLDVSEGVRKQRQSRRREITEQENLLNKNIDFRKNVIQAYRHMYNPSVTFINGDLGFGPVLKQLAEKTTHLLQE